MSKRSKSLRAADAKIDREKLYAPLEAVRLAKETSTSKYDGTVEVAFRLGVDPRKADQMVRGTVNLPHGTGKTARVLVFATGDRAEAAPPRAPTSSAPTSSSTRCRRAVWTSMPSSPPRTSWARSAAWAVSSARVV